MTRSKEKNYLLLHSVKLPWNKEYFRASNPKRRKK